MTKRNRLIYSYALIYISILTILSLIFYKEVTIWFLVSAFANMLNFFILTLLEKRPKEVTNQVLFLNIIIRQIINIGVLLIILFVTKHNQSLLLKSFISSALGFVSIKIGIYIYKGFTREKEV